MSRLVENCPEIACRKCGEKDKVTCEIDTNCVHGDERYVCLKCGHVWWIDGPDA